MKRIITCTLGVAVAAATLAIPAIAQDARNPRTAPPTAPNQTQYQHGYRDDRLQGAARASDIIGTTVKNYQDEKLGEIEDVAVDVESGRVVQVIMSTGGFA